MGSEYEVLYAIACRRDWWIPTVPENYFRRDCLRYWNEMLEWLENMKVYNRRRRKLEQSTYPKRPRKPIRKF